MGKRRKTADSFLGFWILLVNLRSGETSLDNSVLGQGHQIIPSLDLSNLWTGSNVVKPPIRVGKPPEGRVLRFVPGEYGALGHV